MTDGAGNALPETSFAYQISLKYRGYVYDVETGLYYLQSRYYDPNTGRFINADAVEYIGYSEEVLSYNMFAYCENNAVNGWDPNGYIGIVQKTLAQINLSLNYLITLNTKKSLRLNYIYNQNSSYVSKMLYGGNRISYNGCELIAVYNVLMFLDKYMPFYSIIYYAEINDWYLFPIVPTGIFGSSLTKPKKLFQEKGLSFTSYSGLESEKFEKETKNAKICIGSYSNKYSELSKAIYNFSLHTFAFYYNKKQKKYIVFNGYGPSEYNSYSELRAKGRFFLYGFIFK